MTQRWAAVRLQLLCTVGGIPFDVVQATITYELNAIPVAAVTVAVGRNVRTLLPSSVHQAIGRIKARDSFELRLIPVTYGAEGDAPNKWIPATIFKGVVVGTGWQRSTHGASFTIHAQHWLANLHYSSALSGASHPGNPANFTYAAGFKSTIIKTAGGETALHWVPHVKINDLDKADLEADLWESVLKKWMLQVAEQEPIDRRLSDATGNKAAIDAINLIKSEKMAMQLHGPADSKAIGNALIWSLFKAIGRADCNTTLWGKLVGEWSPQYWFAVVPCVENAYVVPFTGALRGDPWVTIRAGDYVQCELNSGMSQLLRAVGISHPIQFCAGGNTNPAEHRTMLGDLAGLYKGSDQEGLVLIKDAPLWLCDAAQNYKYSGVSCGILPSAIPIRSAYTDDTVGPAQDPPNNPADNQEQWRNILDAYAQQWYMIEALKERSGELSGRLRFDVAPGSQVKIESGRDPFIQEDDVGIAFFASVTRVTHVINAELQQAGTSFSLAHIRNERENESDDTSISRPPLYAEGWVGKELVEGYEPL